MSNQCNTLLPEPGEYKCSNKSNPGKLLGIVNIYPNGDVYTEEGVYLGNQNKDNIAENFKKLQNGKNNLHPKTKTP